MVTFRLMSCLLIAAGNCFSKLFARMYLLNVRLRSVSFWVSPKHGHLSPFTWLCRHELLRRGRETVKKRQDLFKVDKVDNNKHPFN